MAVNESVLRFLRRMSPRVEESANLLMDKAHRNAMVERATSPSFPDRFMRHPEAAIAGRMFAPPGPWVGGGQNVPPYGDEPPPIAVGGGAFDVDLNERFFRPHVNAWTEGRNPFFTIHNHPAGRTPLQITPSSGVPRADAEEQQSFEPRLHNMFVVGSTPTVRDEVIRDLEELPLDLPWANELGNSPLTGGALPMVSRRPFEVPGAAYLTGFENHVPREQIIEALAPLLSSNPAEGRAAAEAAMPMPVKPKRVRWAEHPKYRGTQRWLLPNWDDDDWASSAPGADSSYASYFKGAANQPAPNANNPPPQWMQRQLSDEGTEPDDEIDYVRHRQNERQSPYHRVLDVASRALRRGDTLPPWLNAAENYLDDMTPKGNFSESHGAESVLSHSIMQAIAPRLGGEYNLQMADQPRRLVVDPKDRWFEQYLKTRGYTGGTEVIEEPAPQGPLDAIRQMIRDTTGYAKGGGVKSPKHHEVSITVKNPTLNNGAWTNIPSVWDGEVRDEREAVRRAVEARRHWPSFGSMEEAVSAARARSNSNERRQPAMYGDLPAFDAEGGGYDYATAMERGLRPGDDGHWGSVAGVDDGGLLPEGSYLALKGRGHPTWDKLAGAERARGSHMMKVNGRYYSIPDQ